MPTLTETLLGTRLPPGLLPETHDALRAWGCRQLRPPERTGQPLSAVSPTFPFHNLPPSPRLTYTLVDWGNIFTYLALFATDPCPFVDERFKQRAGLEEYAVDLLTDLRYSWKRGGCDWLVSRSSDAQPVGVLHLYDLSHEVIGNRILHCAVGYALAAPFRRQGYGREALRHLLVQAAGLFGRTEARALSAAENLASEALLQTCGFTLLEERPPGFGRGVVRLWQRELAEFSAAAGLMHSTE